MMAPMGIAEGISKGQAWGMRQALLKGAQVMGIVFGPEDLARIEACEDPAVLNRWVERVPSAKSAEQIFE